MAKFRISPALLIGLLVAAFFGISLIYRIYAPYGQIFVGDNIKFANNDSYFYMRLVDGVANNFPHLTQFDPYFIFPGGSAITSLPFFHWLIALFAWIVGLGHPTQHIVDLVGVYLPAIMGALTVIPVFFIGKALFNKWAGVLAAGLIAILPGEFLSRSMLGSADDPVAETLFTVTALAFLIYAIKTGSQNQLTFGHILKRDWKVILKPLILSALAGIFLGLYLITWAGALLFVGIIMLYFIIQFIINHIKQKSSDYLCITGIVTFLLALIILLFNPSTNDITIAMVIFVLIPLVLYGISRLLSSRGLKTYIYPLTLVGIAVVAVVVFRFAAPDIFNSLLDKFKFVFFPSGATAATTTEMTPVLIPDGTSFTTLVAWGNFTTSFFIAPWWLLAGLAGAAICAYLFNANDSTKSGVPLLVFFIIATAMLIALTAWQMPSRYALGDAEIKFIPGMAFISLSVLFYLFIKRGKEQPWYIAVGWVLGILILLTVLILVTTYQDIRYLALIPLAILIFILFRQREGDEHLRLFIIWTLIILMTPLIQRRFQYYFVVNVALLSGYLCWEIIRSSGVARLLKKKEEATVKVLDFSESPKKHDYYELLGVSQTASYKNIKSAFRRLTANYHPGPGNTPEAEEKFRELSKAHETLTNPSRRATYDGSKREAFQKNRWKSRRSSGGNALHYVNVVLAIVVVFLFVYAPNLAKAQAQSSQVVYAISDQWQAALLWMKDNTPEPMGDPDTYYKYYDSVPAASSVYPATAYGVLAWWDYGYWIERVAHRIPNTNPSQWADPNKKAATFFLSLDPATAETIIQGFGSKYVISDYDVSTGKLPAVIQWAGQDVDKFLPAYYVAQENQLAPVQVFSLDYYRSLIVRLYNFDGKAVTGGECVVIAYQTVTTSTGIEVKQVTNASNFATYQEAQVYIAIQDATLKYDIVGTNPFVSPISLDALENYKEIYTSPTTNNTTPLEKVVKIFEYTGNK